MSAPGGQPVGAGGAVRPRRGLAAKPWWPWAKRIAKIVFFCAVAFLLFRLSRSVEWSEVLSTLRDRPRSGLLVAAMLAGGSYLIYCCYDLIGKYLTGHALAKGKVMTVNFICYAFNLNMGSLVGGVAFRYRLYSRLGLNTDTITRVVVTSAISNWIGYFVLGGVVFLLRPFPLPPEWKLDTAGLQVVGILLLATALGYVLACGLLRKRTWTVRGHELTLPPLRVALLQMCMSTANWALIAGTIYVLLGQKVDYLTVLGVMLVAAVAGVLTHVPAGLGVLETVFVTLLGHVVPQSQLIAALLAYRAIYYLFPLLVAVVMYFLVEARAKRAAQGQPAPHPG